jgi:hypothetical protein
MSEVSSKVILSILGITLMPPETGFLRESVGKGEVFSSKNPVSLVGCVIPKFLDCF